VSTFMRTSTFYKDCLVGLLGTRGREQGRAVQANREAFSANRDLHHRELCPTFDCCSVGSSLIHWQCAPETGTASALGYWGDPAVKVCEIKGWAESRKAHRMTASTKRVTLFGIGRLGICTALCFEKAGCALTTAPVAKHRPATRQAPAGLMESQPAGMKSLELT